MNVRRDDAFRFDKLAPAAAILVAFWALAVVLWKTTGHVFFLVNFGYIGTAVGGGMGLYLGLPRRLKPVGRKLAQFLVGAYMLFFLGIFAGENMQLEGFFFYLLGGFFAGAVIHYLVAKAFGPLLFNRGWCGWACWTAAILDLLPYTRNAAGRLPGRREGFRVLHFALSLALVLALWFALGYRFHEAVRDARLWLLAGNILYYASAVVLAYALEDNRAFCKYLCPIPVLQKGPARFSLLKIAGDAEKCTDCGTCTKMCPMDIRIPDYAKSGQRVLSTECILCLTCTTVCPKEALKLSFGLDAGGRELIRARAS